MLQNSKIKVIHPLFFEVQIEVHQLQSDKLQSSFLHRQNTAESYSNLRFGKSIQFLIIVQHLFRCSILPTPDYTCVDKGCYSFYSKKCYENYYKNKKKQQIKFNNSVELNEYKNKYKVAPHLKQSSYCKLDTTYFIIQKHRIEEIYKYFQHGMDSDSDLEQYECIQQKKAISKNKGQKEQETHKVYFDFKNQKKQEYKEFDLQQLSLNQSSLININVQNEQEYAGSAQIVNEESQKKQKPIKKLFTSQKVSSLPTKSEVKLKINKDHILKFKQNYAQNFFQPLSQSKTSIIFESSQMLVNSKESPKLTKKQKQIIQRKQLKKQFVLLKFNLNGEIVGQEYVKKMSFVRNQFLDNYDVYFDQHYSHKLEQKMIMAIADKTFYCKQKYELMVPVQLTQQKIRATQYKTTDHFNKLNKLNRHLSQRKILIEKKAQNKIIKKQSSQTESQSQSQEHSDELELDSNRNKNQQHHYSPDNKYFRIQKRKTLFIYGIATQQIHRKNPKHRKVSHQYDPINPQKVNNIFHTYYKKISQILNKRKQKNNKQSQFTEFEEDVTFNQKSNNKSAQPKACTIQMNPKVPKHQKISVNLFNKIDDHQQKSRINQNEYILQNRSRSNNQLRKDSKNVVCWKQ